MGFFFNEPTPKIVGRERPQVQVRCMVCRDFDAAAVIAGSSLEPADAVEVMRRFREMLDYGLIASDRDGASVGFVGFKVFPGRFDLTSIAVLPSRRRRGIGRALLGGIKSRMPSFRRDRIETVVFERDDAAIAFFVSCGFRAAGLERDWYHPDDGYRMILVPGPRVAEEHGA